jgi:hypothetical protein
MDATVSKTPAPRAVLAYRDSVARRPMPLARVGAGCSLVGLASVALLLPIWASGHSLTDARTDRLNDYQYICSWLVPLLQACLGGMGLALTLVDGRQNDRRGVGYYVSFGLSVLLLVLLAEEMGLKGPVLQRWTNATCPI